MKRFVFKVFIFALLLGVMDVVIGLFFDHALSKTTLTDFGRDNHICNIGTEDILIFGSSRAVHHYNAKMLKDSLGMECYNCGEDGQGIILNYGRLLMETERHQPKIVIYDVQPDYDIEENDNSKYLKWLKPHYDRKGIADIVKSIDEKESWKMMSHLYRYNSEYILLLIALAHTNEKASGNGYSPLNGKMDISKIDETKAASRTAMKTDSIKVLYLKKMIDELKNSQLVFVVSPTWYGDNYHDKLRVIESLCKAHRITFLDFSYLPKYVHRNEFFKDGMHLNSKGADEFTRDLIERLRTIDSKIRQQ